MTGVERRVDLTAVVVSWNAIDLTARCLRALHDYAPMTAGMDVVVVDNGSRDRTAEMVRKDWPHVRLIANATNVGYTRANNQAIALTDAPFLLLINADAFVGPEVIDRMLAVMDAEPNVAVVAPRLKYGDGSWQRWTAGSAPTLGSAVTHYLFLDRLFPSLRGLYLNRDVRESRLVDWVSSACMLVRGEPLRSVGGMNEQYFVYMDDVDLCQRLRDLGWQIFYSPDVEVIHLMGQNTKRRVGQASPAALRSFNRYFLRRHGPGRTAILRTVEVVGFALRVIGYGAVGIARRRPDLLQRAASHLRALRLSLEWGYR